MEAEKTYSGLKIKQLTLGETAYADIFQGIKPAVTGLYVCSDNLDDLLTRPRIAIVGSRKITPYGKAVTAQFAGELARQGIVVVSGLAYGVDAVAHQAALDAGGLTVAVLPSSIEHVYPRAHAGLARRITSQGGALLSEYSAAHDIAYKNQFIERNRIVCGMSDALLITEAAVDSGTMHTARFALEQGKDVLAVPGNINSPASAGTNNLIKAGATPATSSQDVLQLLGISPATSVPKVRGGNSHEQLILDLLAQDVSDGNQLLVRSNLSVEQFNHALTMMEITGKVRPLGANSWSVA